MNHPLQIGLLSIAICLGGVCRSDDAVKITDTKLFSIDYGIRSLEHWIEKLQPGDDQRRTSLLRDHDKLMIRFGRIPTSSDLQYQDVAKRLKQVRQKIGAVKGSGSAEAAAPAAPSSVAAPVPRGLANLDHRLRSLEQDEQRYRDGNPKQRQRVRGDLETLRSAFARMQKSTHPAYSAVETRIATLAKALEPAGGPLAMTNEQVNDYLNEMRTKYYETIRLPRHETS